MLCIFSLPPALHRFRQSRNGLVSNLRLNGHVWCGTLADLVTFGPHDERRPELARRANPRTFVKLVPEADQLQRQLSMPLHTQTVRHLLKPNTLGVCVCPP